MNLLKSYLSKQKTDLPIRASLKLKDGTLVDGVLSDINEEALIMKTYGEDLLTEANKKELSDLFSGFIPKWSYIVMNSIQSITFFEKNG